MERSTLSTPDLTAALPLWRRILSVSAYNSAIDRSRANLIYAFTLFIVGSYTLYALTVPQWPVEGEALTLWSATLRTGFNNPNALLFIALYVLSLGTIIAARVGALELAAWGVPAIWFVSVLLLNIYAQEGIEEIGLAFGQFLVIGSLTKRGSGLYMTTALALFTLIAAYFVRGQTDAVEDIALMAINILCMGLVLWAFLRFFRVTLSSSVSEAINERIQSDKVIAQATQLLETRPPAGQFLHDVINVIAQQFTAIRRAQIYLIEPEVLHIYLAADSDNAQAVPKSIAQETPIDVLPAVSQVFRRGESTFARQNAEAAEWLIPLRLGSETFGVLMLTGSARWFSDQNVRDALGSLTADLSLAIDNVLQFDRAEQRQKENRELIEQANNAVRTVEQLNQRLTRNLWAEYSAGLEETIALDVDFQKTSVSQNQQWTPTLRHALSSEDVVQEINENAQVIAVPLQVRGEVIGAMEFELDTERALSREDMEMLQEVAERFGLTAENTRLLIDSQRQAQREALVNQISLKLQSASDVGTALTEAARGIRTALKADRVSIRLGKPTGQSQGGNHGA
jgi:GAF domain-containing protein